MLFRSGDYKALVLLSGPDSASSVAVATVSSGGVAAVVLIVFDSRGSECLIAEDLWLQAGRQATSHPSPFLTRLLSSHSNQLS